MAAKGMRPFSKLLQQVRVWYAQRHKLKVIYLRLLVNMMFPTCFTWKTRSTASLLKLGLACILAQFQASVVAAEINAPLSALQIGSSMSTVAAAAGEPTFKIERETKREEEWVYSSKGTLLFREGELKSVSLTEAATDSSFLEDSVSHDLFESPVVSNSQFQGDGAEETQGFLREVAEVADATSEKSPPNARPPYGQFPGVPPRP